MTHTSHPGQHCPVYRSLIAAALSIFATFIAEGRTFTVSSPRQVEDCILRQSAVTWHDEQYWTGWNFGAAQTLDIGHGIAMWNMWKGNVLVRFDLRGVPCREVEKATFRIYKPANVTQTSAEVPVALFAVSEQNASWREGSMESMPEAGAASWMFMRDSIPWAGGMNGCSVPGMDHDETPLGVLCASKYYGEWMEFEIPAGLVRKWLEYPEKNAGLLLKTCQEEDIMGDHVLFYSSEHSSGKGPELVIVGKTGRPFCKADPDKTANTSCLMHTILSRSPFSDWTI